jgi:hypothetical protein
MAEGKIELARMHVERSLELEQESIQNQKRIRDIGRLATQVTDYRKSVQQAQMMARATKGMNRLEKQMDLAKVGKDINQTKPSLLIQTIAYDNYGRI